MKANAVTLVVFFSIAAIGLLGPPAAMTEPSECNLLEKRQVIFSDPTLKDTITAEISGKTCDEAMESVRIQDPTGRVLYEFKSALGDGFVREITIEDAQRVIQSLLDGFQPTSALGDWGTRFDVMEPEKMYPIDKSEYERIRAKSWVSYGHQVGYEGYVAVAYDRDRKRVVELIRGSD